MEKAEFDAYTQEQLKRDEVARQWRIAKGEATAEDLKGPLTAGEPKREEWITVLPANRRPQGPSQKSQVSCSLATIKGFLLTVRQMAWANISNYNLTVFVLSWSSTKTASIFLGEPATLSENKEKSLGDNSKSTCDLDQIH